MAEIFSKDGSCHIRSTLLYEYCPAGNSDICFILPFPPFWGACGGAARAETCGRAGRSPCQPEPIRNAFTNSSLLRCLENKEK